MASALPCPRCGYQNTAGYQFCVNCGAPLAAPGTAPPSGTPGYPPAYGHAAPPPPVDYRRAEHIDRSRTGLLLLMIGALLGWLPYSIGVIGLVLSAIGAILVILGRKAFGDRHARYVVMAIVLFVAGILAGLVSGIPLALGEAARLFGSTPTVASLESALNVLLIGAIAAAVIGGLAQVLFTYAIQDARGRILLFAGYGARVALEVGILIVISPLIAATIASAFAGGGYDAAPILALEGQIAAYGIFAVVPDLIFAGAYYLAWSRVNRGEIPPKATAAQPFAVPSAAPPPPSQVPPPSGPAPPINPQ